MLSLRKLKQISQCLGHLVRVYFRASFPRKQIVGQGSRSVPEVIFALTKRSPRIRVHLNARIGVQRKISRRSWLLNKNGNKGFEFRFLDDNIVLFHCGDLHAHYAQCCRYIKAGLRKHKRPIRNMIPSLCGLDCKKSHKLSVFAIYLEN